MFFDYELRRLFDNEHISNYLYSLYHWSKQLGIKMSFSYLIDYGLEKEYLTKDFLRLDISNYRCYLRVINKDGFFDSRQVRHNWVASSKRK